MTSTLFAASFFFVLTILPLMGLEAWSLWFWQENRLRGYRKRYH